MYDSKQPQPFRKNKQKQTWGSRTATPWNKKKSPSSSFGKAEGRYDSTESKFSSPVQPRPEGSERFSESRREPGREPRREKSEFRSNEKRKPSRFGNKPSRFGDKPGSSDRPSFGDRPRKKPFGKPFRSFDKFEKPSRFEKANRYERSDGFENSEIPEGEEKSFVPERNDRFEREEPRFSDRKKRTPFPEGHRRFRKDREDKAPARGRREFSKDSSYFPKKVGEKRSERGGPTPIRIIPAEETPVLPAEALEKIEKSKILIPGKQTEKAPVGTQTPFSDFNLPEEILEALERAEFTFATPIQAESLPHSLEGRDVMGCAQTGTGKTAAFVLPMMKTLMEDPSAMALVLAPTRELADQIVDTLRKLRTEELTYTLLIGGSSFSEQVRSLRRKPSVIVATPGRLVDHIQQRTINLQKVKFFVLDEADRMFDMGFAPQIQKITAQITGEKQTLLFSATFSKEVKQLALNTLNDPVEVFVGETSSVASGVNQEIIEILPDQKFPKLLDELNKREGSVLLFVGMKYKADRLAKNLRSYGHYVDSIHSDRTQGQRRTVLQNFRDQRIRVLVATDVAARGLDIPHVAHVINYDLPNDPEDYVHRLGRTARAGAVGSSLSFVTDEDRGSWQRIAKMLKIEGGSNPPSNSRNRKRGGSRGGNRGGGGKRRFGGRR